MQLELERKVLVAFESDTGAGPSGSDDENGAGSAALAVPVAHQLLHGAGVLPERHAGPFLRAPSERKERPPAWSAPSSPAGLVGAANQYPRARRHITHNYSPQSPFPVDAQRTTVLRPATAGQKHESPAWYLSRLPACLNHARTHSRTHAPTTVHSHRSLAARLMLLDGHLFLEA
jgi:hypothetical protein